MSDLPEKRSADEIKSESIKRSKKNDSPEISGRIDDGTAEVCCHSPPNEGGESVVKQPNSDLTIKPPPPMMAESAEKSDPVSQPKSVVKRPNSEPVFNPDVVMDLSKPPESPSDGFIPLSKPWRPEPDPDSGDKDYIPGLGIPQHLLFDKNRTTSYCIGCGKRTDVKHASEHNKTILFQLPPPKPFEGLFYSNTNCCKLCPLGSCVGHTLETLTSSTFRD